MQFLDFAKAFDNVNHVFLLHKLVLIDVVDSLLKSFASYINNRTLRLRDPGCLSRSFIATSDVPQNSHLGPLLLNAFVNGIVKVVLVKFVLFAMILSSLRT